MNSLFRYIHILSLDVVIGSLASAIMVSKVLQFDPGFAWWIVLPVSVWIVYSADHLLDGYRLKSLTQNQCHLFHYKNRKSIIILIVTFSMIVTFLVIRYLPIEILIFGIALGVFTLFYLILIHRKGIYAKIKLEKEFFISLIYTLGIWGGPIVLIEYHLTFPQLMILLIFLGIAFINTSLLSIFEYRTDEADEQQSIARRLGVKVTMKLLGALSLLLLVSLFGSVIFYHSQIQILASNIILALMILVMLLMIYKQEYFQEGGKYKSLTEGVFWLPALMLVAS